MTTTNGILWIKITNLTEEHWREKMEEFLNGMSTYLKTRNETTELPPLQPKGEYRFESNKELLKWEWTKDE